MPAKNTKAAETALQARTDSRDRREKAAKVARRRLYRQMDEAQQSGVTYVRIAEITGVSPARVGQILAEVRAGRLPE